MSECFICFFFKQKTAYDLRMRDWSSDVCSSDLLQDTVTFGTRWSVFCGFERMAPGKHAIPGTRNRAQSRGFCMALDDQARVEVFASSWATRSEQIAWTARPSSSTQTPSHVSPSSAVR